MRRYGVGTLQAVPSESASFLFRTFVKFYDLLVFSLNVGDPFPEGVTISSRLDKLA